MAARHGKWYPHAMAISQNRTFRWALEPYSQSQDYANTVLDMTWSEYVKELLTWEQENGAFAAWRESRKDQKTEKAPG